MLQVFRAKPNYAGVMTVEAYLASRNITSSVSRMNKFSNVGGGMPLTSVVNNKKDVKKKDVFMPVSEALRICAERHKHWVFRKEDLKKKKPLGHLGDEEDHPFDFDEKFVGSCEREKFTTKNKDRSGSRRLALKRRAGIGKRQLTKVYGRIGGQASYYWDYHDVLLCKEYCFKSAQKRDPRKPKYKDPHSPQFRGISEF